MTVPYQKRKHIAFKSASLTHPAIAAISPQSCPILYIGGGRKQMILSHCLIESWVYVCVCRRNVDPLISNPHNPWGTGRPAGPVTATSYINSGLVIVILAKYEIEITRGMVLYDRGIILSDKILELWELYVDYLGGDV